MIKFALVCAGGHEFESWFQTGAAFDHQAGAGLILCPACRTTKVAKGIMAPAIASRGREAPLATAPAAEASAHGGSAPQGSANVALLNDSDRELRAMIAEMRARILEQTDDVGERFAEEARQIHHGLAPERPIHGVASFADARALIEDGVGILPIPAAPGDYN